MDSFFASIDENRNAFATYTIARIRELLRNLPPARSDLFQSLPFLLHVNMPDFPGYVESDDDIFYGIDRFEQSGFFKFALRHFKLDSETIRQASPEDPVIQGLYLMGSAGTLTQSRNSDFDYWVIIREQQLGPVRLNLLDRKLRLIETWCQKNHHQDVTFFIMDVDKLRQNEFSAVDGESSGSAQRTLLKDEFYRTFIMIAGKIPLWAVLPPEKPDSAPDIGMSDGDYIDTGPLDTIDTRECLGAVLWQVYKSRKDPVKALIKSSLAAYYSFNADDPKALISYQVKTSFSKTRIDDYLFDPYVIVFDTIVTFYEDMNDRQGLELIRQCIILRLLGYPTIYVPDETSPKGRLLSHFVGSWNSGGTDLEHLRGAAIWSEAEKIAFEDRIFDKLSFLYELILRSTEDDGAVIAMKPQDLTILKNRTAGFIQKKPGKIPRCSTFLRQNAPDLVLRINHSAKEQEEWTVYSDGNSNPLFTGRDYLKIIGWIFANQLHTARFTSVSPHFTAIKAFLNPLFPRPDHVFTTSPRVEKIVILFKRQGKGLDISAADHLIINTWGEFYFDSTELSSLESINQKCYKTAEFIFNIQSKNSGLKLQYLICLPEEDPHHSLEDTVRCHLEQLVQTSQETDKPLPDKAQAGDVKPPEKNKPFLDLI